METKQTGVLTLSHSAKELFIIVGAFVIPALFSGPQWVIGIVVNALLFSYAMRVGKKMMWGVSVLPSLGAVMHGVVFGNATVFLLYFLPFIWFSNFCMMRVFLRLKQSYTTPLALIISSVGKAAVLFLPAFTLVHLHIVPSIFLSSMGVIQLATALCGGILALWMM